MSLLLYTAMLSRTYMSLPHLAQSSRTARRAYKAQADADASILQRTSDRFEISDKVLQIGLELVRADARDLLHLYEHIALPADRIWVEFDYLRFNQLRVQAGLLPSIYAPNTRMGFLMSGLAHSQTDPIKIQVYLLSSGVPVVDGDTFEFRSKRSQNWDPAAINQYSNSLSTSGIVLGGVPPASFYAWGSTCDRARSAPAQKPATDRLYDLGWSYPAGYTPLNSPSTGTGTLAVGLAMLAIIANQPAFRSTRQSSN